MRLRRCAIDCDDLQPCELQDLEDETGRQISLAEHNYVTAVVLGYGPADEEM